MKPVPLFLRSLAQFAFGLGPAMLLALVCLAIQLGLLTAVARLEALVPREWSMRGNDVLLQTVWVAVPFFFHVLVVLLVTAWLLRKSAPLSARGVFRRALRGAALATPVAAVLFAVAFVAMDRTDAATYSAALVVIALWFVATTLVLPARLMGHEPAAPSRWPVAIALLPWLFASEIVGAPLRNCGDCWGLFDGGVFTIPLLAAYLFGLTLSSAAVSAAACLPPQKAGAPAGAGAP